MNHQNWNPATIPLTALYARKRQQYEYASKHIQQLEDEMRMMKEAMSEEELAELALMILRDE